MILKYIRCWAQLTSMEIIGIDTKDVRFRIHIRVGSSDGDDLVAYGLPRHVDELPPRPEGRVRRSLSDHQLERYPEGAYLGVFASSNLKQRDIRDPDTVISDPYPHDIELTEFPPEENQLYKW